MFFKIERKLIIGGGVCVAFTKYLREKVLDDHFVESEIKVALFTGDPTDDDGKEVDVGEYERQSIEFETTSDDNISLTNKEEIKFPVATESYGEITHSGIFDKDDNLLDFSKFEAERKVEISDQIVIPAGSYTIKLD